MIDAALLAEHLALATRHVEEGAVCVAKQRKIAAELLRDGHDAREANALLAQFESLQKMFVDDRDRIAAELKDALSGKLP